MLYALLQPTLSQKIDRKVLEEASVFVPSVARADCARLARELFGIIADHLPLKEAQAFQTALAHSGIRTEIVPQEELPLLMEPVRRRGIRFGPEHFIALDGMGRGQSYPWAEVQFAAGGFVELVKFRTESSLRWRAAPGSDLGSVMERKEVEERVKEAEFRLELFLSCEPYRLQFLAQKDSLFAADDVKIRFHQQDAFVGVMHRVAALLPADCLNQGMQAAARGERFSYPSPAAFDEELIWHLFQSLRRK